MSIHMAINNFKFSGSTGPGESKGSSLFGIISVIWLPIGTPDDNNTTVLVMADDITLETLTPS
jgi:hypothetical protein